MGQENREELDMGEIQSKIIVEHWKTELKTRAKRLFITPRLNIIQVGNDSASDTYVNTKLTVAREIGIEALHINLPENTTTEELIKAIDKFGRDPVILQLPVPLHIKVEEAIRKINYLMDVDGFTIEQTGLLTKGSSDALVPATAAGVLKLLLETVETLEGKKVTIVNRSQLIGLPLSQLLIQHHAQVTIIHSRIDKEQQQESLREADIVITGCCKRKIFNSSHFRDNQILIDCSMHREEGVAGVGDMDKEEILQKLKVKIASGYGHTGPATVAALMDNVLKVYELQQ